MHLHLPLGQVDMRCCQVPSTSCDLCTCKDEVAMSNGLGMHLQENTLFELDLGVRVAQNIAQYHLHNVTIYTCKVLSCNVKWFRRCINKEKKYLTFEVTRNVAQYPLHNVNCKY